MNGYYAGGSAPAATTVAIGVDAQDRVFSLLGELDDLEAFPWVVNRALSCLADSRSNSGELAAILSTDQTIAGRLLGAANSVLYRGNRRFVTVHEAVVRLGYRNVRQVLLVVALGDAFHRPLHLYGMAGGELWTHSLATAVAARLIAESTKAVNAETAYLAGLLHDVGRLALSRRLSPASSKAISAAVRVNGVTYHQAEHRELGFTHADASAILLRQWGVGEDLVSAAAAHHDTAVEDGPLAWVVHVADVLGVMAFPPKCTMGWIWAVDPNIAKWVGLERWLEGRGESALETALGEIRQGTEAAARLIQS
ncbi:MAG: HDOD domain-containing protein [Chloroflexota bacterium]